MVLGLVGFPPKVSEPIERMVTMKGHFCMTFEGCGDLEAMIRDEVELPCFDSLIYEGDEAPRITRFSLGFITRLRGELYRELCIVTARKDEDFWEPLEGEVDQWLKGISSWKCEVIYLFGDQK